MLNQCPSCGGQMVYDITTAKLYCAFCKSSFDPETYESKTNAEEHSDIKQDARKSQEEDYQLTIFTCPACGAQISSTELSAVDYCMYCGSFVTLESQLQKVRKPDKILPFAISEEECKKSYAKMIRRKLYAPAAFRDSKFLNGFKGIYIPYWSYDYTYGPKVDLYGKTTKRRGNYLHVQNYSINCQMDGKYEGVTYDASSTFDDEISNKIAPFHYDHVKPFNPAYMFGFFGDTADVPDATYDKDADSFVRDRIWESVSSDKTIKKNNPQRPVNGNSFDSRFKLKQSHSLIMMPVWFLTWRKNDKIAYSIVNGDSGDIFAEIPVDITRYLIISLITAIPIFLLLNSRYTFNGTTMLTFAMILSVLMLLLYIRELERIVQRRFHINDKGYLAVHKDDEKKIKNYKDNFILSLWDIFKDFTINHGAAGFLFLFIAICCFGPYSIFFLLILIFFAPIYIVYRSLYCAKIMEDKTVMLDCIGAMAALIGSILTLLFNPASDMFYYTAAILCMIAIGFTAVRTMLRYNDLITRPIPHFFEREKGGKV